MSFEHSRAHPDDAAGATVLDPADPTDRETLRSLREDPAITFVDRSTEQAKTLAGLLPAPPPELTDEPRRWAYYPWRRTVVGVLGPRGYARVRLGPQPQPDHRARNRTVLGALRIGVVGLSVGHAVAHTLAMQGMCGELRLADFDELELSNLNRVPATVFDLGVNKAHVAARRIAEVDPYITVRVGGIGPDRRTRSTEFLDGLDVVVEECDSLDVKALVREAARRTTAAGADGHQRPRPDRRRDGSISNPTGRSSTACSATSTPRCSPVWTAERRSRTCCGSSTAADLSARGAASLVEVGQTPVDVAAAGRRRDSSAPRRLPRRFAESVWANHFRRGGCGSTSAAALDGLTDPCIAVAAARGTGAARGRTRRRCPGRGARSRRGGQPRAVGRQCAALEHRDGAGRGDHPARPAVPRPRSTSACAAARWRSARRCSTRGSPRPPIRGSVPVDVHGSDGPAPLTAVIELTEGTDRRARRAVSGAVGAARPTAATAPPSALDADGRWTRCARQPSGRAPGCELIADRATC